MGAYRTQSAARSVASSPACPNGPNPGGYSSLKRKIRASRRVGALAGFPVRAVRIPGPRTASRRSFASPVVCLAPFLTRLLKLIRDWSRSDSRGRSSDRWFWQLVGNARRSCPGSREAAGSVPGLARGPGGGPRACRRSVAVRVQSRREEWPLHQRGPRRSAFASSVGSGCCRFPRRPPAPGLQLRA